MSNLLCLLARDRDTGANGKVMYEIVAGNDQNLFTINAHSGTLSSDSLNFEDRKGHTLIIRATDQGVPPRSHQTTVKILVTDVNDPPKFSADDIKGILPLDFWLSKVHISVVSLKSFSLKSQFRS